MKKFLSILIVPLVAVLMLCGCGRTMRTVEDITKLFEQNKNVYSEANIQGSQTNNNWYFKDDSYMMRVVYDNEANLNVLVNKKYSDTNSLNNASDLDYKYWQLRGVYERELAMIYSYYNYYADTFYANAEAKEVSEEELTNLYDKIRDMFKQLESFNSSKIDLEREVKLYGNDSQILSASLDKFNSAYNGLVRKSLDMVEYFRDLHFKYFFEGVNNYDYTYAIQLHYDALLALAEYIYNDYMVPLTSNSVTTLIDVKKAIIPFLNIFTDETFNKIVDVNHDGELVYVTKTSAAVTEAQIRQFENSLNTFKQYYKLYLKAFNKIDVNKYYDFRYARNGVTADVYRDKNGVIIDVAEFANVTVVSNFESTSVSNLLNALNEIIV